MILNLAQSLLLIDKDSPKEIMSTQNAKPEEKTSGSDMALVSLAVILALAGVCGFSFLSDQTLLVRLGVLIGMVIAFVVVVAVFLFLVDMIVEWGLYDVLLKLSL